MKIAMKSTKKAGKTGSPLGPKASDACFGTSKPHARITVCDMSSGAVHRMSLKQEEKVLKKAGAKPLSVRGCRTLERIANDEPRRRHRK